MVTFIAENRIDDRDDRDDRDERISSWRDEIGANRTNQTLNLMMKEVMETETNLQLMTEKKKMMMKVSH